MPEAKTYLTLNNAGNHPDNPILPRLQFKMYYHRHDATEEFWKCWIQYNGEIYTELTEYVYSGEGVEFGKYVVIVDSTIDFKTGTSDAGGPELNKVIWTTSFGEKVTHLYVAQEPAHDILVNGYNAGDPLQPFLDPVPPTSETRDSNYEYPYTPTTTTPPP